jgi:predicted DNA binding protein
MNDSTHSDAPGSVDEVSFTISDSTYPFVGLSAEADCRVELERMVPREAGRYAEFFSVAGADPARVMTLAKEHDSVDPAVIARDEDGGLFEFVVSDGCPARRLAELGGLPQEVEGVDGNGRIVAEVPPGYDASDVAAEFLEEYASAELICKREKDRPTPLFAPRDLERAIEERLTDRQGEILRTAYAAGYYERPRKTTGEAIATDLGISAATFSQHIRAAEQNLLGLLYEEEENEDVDGEAV